jgi:hypothetical protein
MKRLPLLIAFVAVAIAHAQTSSPTSTTWIREDKIDQFRGTKYVQFALPGRYLTPPSNSSTDFFPTIVVRCLPGENSKGHRKGKLIDGRISVGTIVDTDVAESGSVLTLVQYRLDDGKVQAENWPHSTNFSAIFFGGLFPDSDLSNILYGHVFYHKENTTPPVRKLVVSVPEYLAGDVVMQFDLPDPAEVAEACGVIWHK